MVSSPRSNVTWRSRSGFSSSMRVGSAPQADGELSEAWHLAGLLPLHQEGGVDDGDALSAGHHQLSGELGLLLAGALDEEHLVVPVVKLRRILERNYLDLINVVD